MLEGPGSPPSRRWRERPAPEERARPERQGSSPPCRPRPASPSGATTTGRTAIERSSTRSRGKTRASPSWVIGHTIQGREILALKLTKDARDKRDGARRPSSTARCSTRASGSPARSTSACSLVHRERVPDERSGDQEAPAGDTELWFVPVANPDGYQYTFESPDTRLWRKNLRDNNGNGTIEVGDGVDPNRNYPEHWNYDEEGSSTSRRATRTAAPAPRRSPRRRPSRDCSTGSDSLPGELPLVRPVAPVSGGLADRHADRGRPDLFRALREPRQPGDRGLPAGLSAPTSST